MSRKSAIEILKDQKTRDLIKRLFKEFTRPYLRFLIGGFICMGLVSLTAVASAKLIEPIINDIFVSKRADMLMPITITIFFVFFLKGLATYGESICLSYVGQRIVADIQKKMFQQVIQCDLAFYHQTPTGELVSRFTNDIHKLNNAVTGTLTNIGKDGFMFCAFIIFMFYQNAFLATLTCFVLPIAIMPLIRMGKRMRKASTHIQEYNATFTSLLTQAFQGIRLIKAYNLETQQEVQIHKNIEDIFHRTFKASRVRSASHPLMEFLGGIAIAIVVIYGGSQVISGKQNPGSFFSFITALLMTYEPLKRLANLNATLQDQMAAVTRVFKFLDLTPFIKEIPQAQILKIKRGEIRFQNVHFSYGEEEVLKGIDLVIPAGKTGALVGTSGAGKSTILNLIPRFYDISQGKLMIDGLNIQQMTLSSLRQNIALVSQDVTLFDASIRTNISFGNPQATDQQIKAAAEAAAAHDFILSLPQGYETRVREQGMRLSGGQRQRIAIARALLKDAPLLLLDEPTSALDSDSEQIIQEALKTLMKNRTTLIIAHRLTTVQEADIIFVIDQGRVTASGRHVDLIHSNSRYAQLCKAQFKTTFSKS